MRTANSTSSLLSVSVRNIKVVMKQKQEQPLYPVQETLRDDDKENFFVGCCLTGKKKILDFFFFATIFALHRDPNLKGYLMGLKYM